MSAHLGGSPPGKTFVDLFQMARQRNGLPRANFEIASETSVPSPPTERCVRLTGRMDAQDGKGMNELNSVFCSGPLSTMGQYMNIANHTLVPMNVADKERGTIGAIMASFNVNNSVVNAQAAAIAASAIHQIQEIGRQAVQQAV